MSDDQVIEELMNLFEVRVDAFAVCDIARTAALKCDAFDKVVVHFVLKGTGVIEYDGGRRPLRPTTTVIIPRGTAKVISGDGPIETVDEASELCPLDTGLMEFKSGTDPDLVLACAAVDASIGGVIDVFEHLWEPMVENVAGTSFVPLFHLIRNELASQHLGTRAVVGALMKQILIGVFRSQLSEEAYRSWLWPAMLNPRLGKAALAMMSRPQDHHTIESLAGLAGMSRAPFAALFMQEFHRTPVEFLQVVRLRIARRLLITSSLPIKSIAAAVGYFSRSHFSRSFHARYGIDPSAFRKSSRPVAA